MIKVDQTILASDPIRLGNCVSACVATVCEVPLEEVPHFIEFGSDLAGDGTDQSAWWWVLVGYMAGRGLHVVEIELDEADPGEVVFVSGPSPRGVAHQVLYRDGALWHDPHPSRAGLLSLDDVVLAWRPAKWNHAPTEAAG